MCVACPVGGTHGLPCRLCLPPRDACHRLLRRRPSCWRCAAAALLAGGPSCLLAPSSAPTGVRWRRPPWACLPVHRLLYALCPGTLLTLLTGALALTWLVPGLPWPRPLHPARRCRSASQTSPFLLPPAACCSHSAPRLASLQPFCSPIPTLLSPHWSVLPLLRLKILFGLGGLPAAGELHGDMTQVG